MTPLFTQEEFKKAKSKDKLPCKCKFCKKTFYRTKSSITVIIKKQNHNTMDYCSQKCSNKSHIKDNTFEKMFCSNCGKEIIKQISASKRHKNCFCSHSCSTKYFNSHKKNGIRRSKLEVYIEQQLTALYPNLHILYNDKETINSELDVYIPSLKIAFELNGIFHYEPIFGVDKLEKIQNNDTSKFKSCYNKKIDLCIIDVSQQKYFKESTSKKYLSIIIEIINERLLIS